MKFHRNLKEIIPTKFFEKRKKEWRRKMMKREKLFFLFCFLFLLIGCESLESVSDETEKRKMFFSVWNSLPFSFKQSAFQELRQDLSFIDENAQLCDVTKQNLAPIVNTKGGALYSAKLRTEGVDCKKRALLLSSQSTIDVYRLGEIRSFPFLYGCTTYRDLLQHVQESFGDRYIQHFWRRDTRYIDIDEYIHPLPKKKTYKQFIIATRPLRTTEFGYEREERFFFPAVRVGEVVPVLVRDSTDSPPREVTVTTLALEPKIFMIDNILSHEECDQIMDHVNNLPPEASATWMKSSVGSDTAHSQEDTSIRYSETLWVDPLNKNSNEVTKRVHSRTQAFLKHAVEVMEPFQLVRYPPKGHYYFHTDSFSASERNGDNPYIRGGGNRFATMVIYLTQPTGGGYTAFPHVGVPPENVTQTVDPVEGCNPEKSFVVPPKKGSAALFYDVLEDQHMEGILDERTTHAGCDTEEGVEKVIMNQWYRNKRVPVNDKWHMYDSNW